MFKRNITLFLVVAFVLMMVTTAVSAAPDAPGSPTLRWVTTGLTTAELRADGITNGGVAGNGAMNWDLYFRFPGTVSAPYPVVSVVAGPAFLAQAPCGFQANVSMNLPSAPGATGDRGVIINGFCGSGVPNNPVTGDNVLVATVTFAGCPAGNPAGFVMDLDSGDDVFGASVAQMYDRSLDAHTFSDSDLTDGSAMCASPTAVTMSGFDAAANSPAPFAAASWPLLAGAAAVAAAGAYALLRRKS
jgi:hypothetical protein